MLAMATVARPQLAAREAGPVFRNAYGKFLEHNSLTYAAALAFYFFMSLFPFLILLASVLALLPYPHLFDRFLRVMSNFMPPDGMKVVRYVLTATLKANSTLFSLSVLTVLWAAAGAFNAVSTALNVAYEVKESRSLLKRRFLALTLTCLIGMMVTVALTAIALGPRFGLWLTAQTGLTGGFAWLWPNLRLLIVMVLMVTSVATLYYFAPNRRQRFRSLAPGALIAVAAWLMTSGALGWYVRSLADYSKIYGALGAVVALMLWFYVSAAAILAGAEVNAELQRRAGR